MCKMSLIYWTWSFLFCKSKIFGHQNFHWIYFRTHCIDVILCTLIGTLGHTWNIGLEGVFHPISHFITNSFDTDPDKKKLDSSFRFFFSFSHKLDEKYMETNWRSNHVMTIIIYIALIRQILKFFKIECSSHIWMLLFLNDFLRVRQSFIYNVSGTNTLW